MGDTRTTIAGLTSALMRQACSEFLSPREQRLVEFAKTYAPLKYGTLLTDAIVGKHITLEEFAREALRCARLALQPGST